MFSRLVGSVFFLAVLTPIVPVAAQDAPPPPAVGVLTLEPQEIANQASFTGRIEAFSRVEIVPRVSGTLLTQEFTDGQTVEEGDLLFTIEREIYQSQRDAAAADVARQEAIRAQEQLDVQRARTLVERGTVSQAQLDLAEAEFTASQAALAAARAELALAEVNLGYTRITAPIAGRISRAGTGSGNLVAPGTGVLATIVQSDPMQVVFRVDEATLLDLRQRRALQGQIGADAFRVSIRFGDGDVYDHPVELSYVGVEVSPTTDTVEVAATIPNPDEVLLHGQLVTVDVSASETEPRLLVPQTALQLDQQGIYVLAVDEENRVQKRYFTVGDTRGPDVIVDTGLDAGARIVVEGIQKARPGAVIAPQPVFLDR